MPGQAVIFLDRDNTINYDPGYLSDPTAVHLLHHAAEGLRLLRDHGLPLILISNQAGVGRGYFSEATLGAVHARLLELLAEQGIGLEAAYYCLHAPDADCECRKPKPGMLLQAAHEHGIDLAASWMIGDKVGDIEAGRSAGCRTILIQQPAPEPLPLAADATCPDLLAAAHVILGA